MSFYDFEKPAVGAASFVGRSSLIRALSSGLSRGRSFALVGGPRTGKTSLLQHFIHTIHESWRRRADQKKIVPIYIDLSGSLKVGWRGFAEFLWKEILEGLQNPLIYGNSPPPVSPNVSFRGEKSPWELLNRSLAEHWDGLRGTKGWCEYVLLIDNGDLFMNRQLDGVVDYLAELAKQEGAWAPISLIVSGGRALRENLFDEGFSLAHLRLLFLSGLNENEAERLIRQGLDSPSDDLVRAIISATGRHPYLLQRILFELEDSSEDIGIEGAVDRAAEDCLRLFEQIWDVFDFGRDVTYRGAYAAPEHALMSLLLEGLEGVSMRQAEREIGIRPLKEFAELLDYLGVVEKKVLGDFVQYRAHFELWSIWYQERIAR